MSEKLTVAELLARNGREADPADTGRRRRRHRNLEKGGVSVAELTGSIPVVQTEDDAASDESVAKAADKPADKAAPKAAAKDTVAAQPERQEEKEKKEKEREERRLRRTVRTAVRSVTSPRDRAVSHRVGHVSVHHAHGRDPHDSLLSDVLPRPRAVGAH